MSYKELFDLLSTLKIPVAYNHFEESQNVMPPFLIYRERDFNTLYADDINYFDIENFELELVTIKKDIQLENKISNLLKENNIAYAKEPSIWDSEEKIYHTIYDI